jgi:thermitase
MQLTKRRITVGLISTAVVASLVSVTDLASAAETGGTSGSASPVRLVVGYKADQLPASAVKRFAAAGVRAAGVDHLRAATTQVPATRSAALIASLRSDPNVAYVEVDHVYKINDVNPTDPDWVGGKQPEMREVNLPAAWETTTGSAVTIAVLDTGVNAQGDLAGAVLGGYDFANNDSNPTDDHGHGTMVSSLIAARADNDQGMAGACWACQILPVKVLDSEGSGYASDIAKGITWAVQHGAKVINMSLGQDVYSQVLADAVAYANASGVLVVAAAGNYNTSAREYPAALPDVLAVGATAQCPNYQAEPACTDGTNDRAYFSNFNSASDKWVDIAAPGTVRAMNNAGVYSSDRKGTSFSAPIVSGIAGLIKSNKPSFTGWSMMWAMLNTATPIGSWTTYGKVDAAKALTWDTETSAPTILGLSPAQNAKVRGTVTFTPYRPADVGSGIRLVTLSVDGVAKGGATRAPWAVAWNSAGRNGTAKIQIRLYDKAGNTRAYDRIVIADNTPPAVRITKAPKNKAKIKGTVKIYYTGSDTYGVKNYQLIINGKVVSTHTGTPAFSFVASKYPKSSIRVQVRAYDVAGNSRITSTLTYHR